jgi:hypothetical protein
MAICMRMIIFIALSSTYCTYPFSTVSVPLQQQGSPWRAVLYPVLYHAIVTVNTYFLEFLIVFSDGKFYLQKLYRRNRKHQSSHSLQNVAQNPVQWQ